MASTLGRFQRHIVLLGVRALLADDLEQQVGPLAGGNSREKLHRLIVVQLRLQLALKIDMAGKAAADLDLDLLARVVADALRIDLMVVPADDRGIFLLDDRSRRRPSAAREHR